MTFFNIRGLFSGSLGLRLPCVLSGASVSN